jgi:hypothetical protein
MPTTKMALHYSAARSANDKINKIYKTIQKWEEIHI